MKWMELAWADFGQAEIAGPRANERILSWFQDVERPEITSDEIHNCAAFVGSCLVRGGVSIDSIPKSRRLLARSYMTIGSPSPLRKGAIVVIARPGGGPTAGHVFFVEDFDDRRIMGLGANQGDKVSVAEFRRSEIEVLAIRWPEAAEDTVVVEAPLPVGAAARPLGELLAFSRTVRGALHAFLGSLILFFESVLGLMLEAAAKVQELAPLKGLFAEAGANVQAIGFGFVVWGVSWVVIGRWLAEGKR